MPCFSKESSPDKKKTNLKEKSSYTKNYQENLSSKKSKNKNKINDKPINFIFEEEKMTDKKNILINEKEKINNSNNFQKINVIEKKSEENLLPKSNSINFNSETNHQQKMETNLDMEKIKILKEEENERKNKQSIEFKENGNIFFGKKEYEKAIKLYSEAIVI